jgi:uncharacterized protein
VTRVLFSVVGILVTVATLFALVRWLEPRFAFFPSAGETSTPAELGAPFVADTVATSDGERLRVWVLPHERARAFVVYFHGNGGNLSVWMPILVGVQRRGFTVLAFDYRGFGLSTGRPTENGLYRDVDAIVEYAWRRSGSAAPIVYWGRSLGTTMAAYAATARPPLGIVLESGFPDARSLIRSSPPMAFLSLFSTYRFPTAEFMRRTRVPALVLHGDYDTIVPFALGRALFDGLPGPKEFVRIPGGDHNDATPPDPASYWAAVDAFIDRLRR